MCLWMAFFLSNIAGLRILEVLTIVLAPWSICPLLHNSSNTKTNSAGISAVKMCDCCRYFLSVKTYLTLNLLCTDMLLANLFSNSVIYSWATFPRKWLPYVCLYKNIQALRRSLMVLAQQFAFSLKGLNHSFIKKFFSC
jgi:hypothetical protein